MSRLDELLLELIRAYPHWRSSYHLPAYSGGVGGRLLKPLIEEGIVEKQKRSRTTLYRLKVFDPEWIRTHQWTAAAVMNPHRRFCINREGDKIWLVMMKDVLNFDMAND